MHRLSITRAMLGPSIQCIAHISWPDCRLHHDCCVSHEYLRWEGRTHLPVNFPCVLSPCNFSLRNLNLFNEVPARGCWKPQQLPVKIHLLARIMKPVTRALARIMFLWAVSVLCLLWQPSFSPRVNWERALHFAEAQVSWQL